MLTYIKNPFGFISPKDDAHGSVESGDSSVNQLLNHFRLRSASSWDSRELVIELARRLFRVTEPGEPAGLKSFLEYQLKHSDEHFSSSHFQFLVDTIKFIRTGQRRVHVATSMTLLQAFNREAIKRTDQQIRYLFEVKQEAIQAVASLTPEEDVYFISKWMSYPNGLSDLIYSLIVLFGGKQDMDIEPYEMTVKDFMS